MHELEKKIKDKKAVVSVVGLGYVGLPLIAEFAKAGFRAIGFDIDDRKVNELNAGRSYLPDVPSEEIAGLVAEGRLSATTDFGLMETVDTVSICVPTPLRKTKDPDISYVVKAVEIVKKNAHAGMLIVLESTTYPGTTSELLLPELQREDFKVGTDFCLAFSPERIDPGNKIYKTRNIPKVIGGITATCTRLAALLYRQIVERVVPVSSPRTAEMVKLLENTFRAVNIGLVNEIAIMCDKLGIDTWEVIEAAATKPFGFMKFTPGPGLGGECIPVDPHYLSWKLKMLNYTARFINLASEVSSHMPDFVVDKIAYVLNDEKKCLNGSKILVLGVTYKKDVADYRESPILQIIKLLQQRGCTIFFHDPYIQCLEIEGLDLKGLNSNPNPKFSELGWYDCVVIGTDHSSYDYQSIVTHSKLIFDTRNATAGFESRGGAKIVKL